MGLRRGRFIVLQCVRPWIITAVFTPRLLNPPRSLQPAADQTDRCLLKAQTGGGVAVFYHLRVTDVSTAGLPCSPLGGACAIA